MLKLYDSLTKQEKEFDPVSPGVATVYCCGPTVYIDAHIGNHRTNYLADLVHRVLKYDGYKVKYVMNITDVGHLSTGSDDGEDKLEESATREGKSAKEIADFYLKGFFEDYEKLNLLKPTKFTRATDYIKQQINLVKSLEDKNYTYKTSDGIYFDTSKFAEYGQLSGVKADKIKEGARVEINPEKKNPTDFALWKLSPENTRRWQEWPSPWGTGFPGWHLECSAMVLEELGDTIDIHIGGEDLRMIHHQNEIAQSECSTGVKFVNFWMHGAFLQVDGGKMSKSEGTSYTLSDVKKKGFSAIDLRYFYMNAHYRSSLNFTWEALKNSQSALKKLYEIVEGYKESPDAEVSQKHISKFNESLYSNLNVPTALAVVWDMIKSDVKESVKIATILKMDEVLGLNFAMHVGYEIPRKIIDMAKARQAYKKSGIWDKADMIRREIRQLGFKVEDLPGGEFKVKRGE